MTREQITAIYEEVMGKQPPAGKTVIAADDNIQNAFDDYLSAIRYETFLWAYEMGFAAGKTSTEIQTTTQDRIIQHTLSVLQRLNTRNARQVKAYVDVLYKFEMEERERCSGLR